MNDPVFRRALAESINVSQIVNNVYGQIVAAANPTGLLPVWNQYVNQSLVKQYGFTYNPTDAKAILTAAGYKMGSDGYFENKDGSPIDLELIVPNGWTDWMAAIQSIAQSAKAGGIKITPRLPGLQRLRRTSSRTATSTSPSSTTSRSATRPGRTTTGCSASRSRRCSVTGNYGRYANASSGAWSSSWTRRRSSNVSAMKAIISQIQKIQLQDMPIIPLWYNGVWAQANNGVWTNWPSSASGSPHYVPCTWRGYWNMGAVLMLATLKPVPTRLESLSRAPPLPPHTGGGTGLLS